MFVSYYLGRIGQLRDNSSSRLKSITHPIFWLRCVYGAALFVIVAYLVSDLCNGGHFFKQADWLINNHRIIVRRGLFGSVFIGLADLIGLRPLLVVVLAQGLLVTIATILTLWAAKRVGVTWKLFLILSSEGFFLPNWASEDGGAARKELFVYLAFALLAHGATYPRLPKVHLGLFILALVFASAGNEGLALALPTGLLLLACAWDWKLTSPRLAIAAVILLSVAAAALVNAHAPPIATPDPVCAPLLSRGLHPEFCNGAIAALTHSLSHEMGQVRHDLWCVRLPGLVFAYTLGGLPFVLYLYDERGTDWRQVLLFGLVGLGLVPLFVIANDWGRWITIHFTSATYLFLVMRARGTATEGHRTWPSSILVSTALLSLTVGYSHVFASPKLGMLKHIVPVLSKIVRSSI